MPTSFCSDHDNWLPLLYSLLPAVTALYSYAIVNEWLELYIARFWISTKVGYWQCCLVVTWLGTHETAAFSVNILCSSVQRFIWSHIRRVHVCLAVTCHWHLWQIWQNDWDHLWCVGWGGGGVTEIRVGTECWPWRRMFSCCCCQDSNQRPQVPITTPAPYHRAISASHESW